MTDDDRNLIELAAKAAGLKIERMHEEHAVAFLAYDQQWPRSMFSPLADDGDALRLAVSVGLTVEVRPKDGGCFAWRLDQEFDAREWGRVGETGSIAAATRRAIVRAAAEIGRSMP